MCVVLKPEYLQSWGMSEKRLERYLSGISHIKTDVSTYTKYSIEYMKTLNIFFVSAISEPRQLHPLLSSPP